MTLLEKILAYSDTTNEIRQRYAKESNRLKTGLDANLLECDNEIKRLNQEIQSLEKKADVCKSDIKLRIAYDSKSFLYKSFEGIIESFQMEDRLNPKEGIPSKTVDKLKEELTDYLTRIKVIKEVAIPELNSKKVSYKEKYESDLAIASKKKEDSLDEIRNPLKEEYASEFTRTVASYTDDLTPLKNEGLPDVVTIGNYVVESNKNLTEITSDDPLLIPCDLKVRDGGNLIIKIDSNHLYDNDNFIENVITGVAMKYLESFPSGHLRLGIYSSSITSFGKLSALFAGSLKGKISLTTETSKTRDQFAKLLISVSEKGEMINSKLLENGCSDLVGLYEEGITTEDFQLLIIHDAFRDMTLDSINQLHGCISELSRCGLHFIIIDDFNEEIYKNKSSAFVSKMNQIIDVCETFTIDGKTCTDSKGNVVNFVDASKVEKTFVFDFVSRYCSYALEKKAPYLSYEKVGFGKSEPDKNNFESIVIPVGTNEPNVWNIEFDCVGHSPNANFIVGIPGTGKSTLIDSLIMNGAMKYSPDEVNFQLLDFKDGSSSLVYTMPGNKIPHIKVVSQNNKPEEADIILSNILIESERRNREFVKLREETGLTIRDIVGYNKAVASLGGNRKNMPRLIIVVDECQYLFDEEALAEKCVNIVRKCRSQGIHLVLATQTISHKMWGVLKFVEGKYCFEIAKDDAEQLMERKYANLISTEVPKGSYMAFAYNKVEQDYTKIKIAYDGGNTAKYAKQIREKWSDYPIDLVIIGDKSPMAITKSQFISYLSASGANDIPVGENYNDHKMTAISYENKRPMFLVGSTQKAADSILKSVVLAASIRNIETYVIDASNQQNLLKYVEQINKSNVMLGNEKDYLSVLQKVFSLYKTRESDLRASNPPVFLIVNGLQNIVDFLNNAKYEDKSLNDKSNVDDMANLSMKEIAAMLDNRARQQAGKNGLSINGRESLIPFLFNNAYKANIFICVSSDSITLTNDDGEQVFGYAQKNIIKNCDYKVLYPNCGGDVRDIMENSFKEKMVKDLSEDMAFMSIEQRDFCKIRYYQIEDGGDD